MQLDFFDSNQQNLLPGISTIASLTLDGEEFQRPSGISSCSHLYLRGSLYYFRYKFPRPVRIRLGHTEFRMSLKTGHMRWAKYIAARLYAALQPMISGVDLLNYNEICRRMNILMQQLLEDELQKSGWFADVPLPSGSGTDPDGRSAPRSFLRPVLEGARDWLKFVFPSKKLELAPLIKESIAAEHARVCSDPEKLAATADKFIPGLLRLGYFREDEITVQNRGLIARCFLETLNEHYWLREESKKGNRQAVQEALAKNYGPIFPESVQESGSPAEAQQEAQLTASAVAASQVNLNPYSFPQLWRSTSRPSSWKDAGKKPAYPTIRNV